MSAGAVSAAWFRTQGVAIWVRGEDPTPPSLDDARDDATAETARHGPARVGSADGTQCACLDCPRGSVALKPAREPSTRRQIPTSAAIEKQLGFEEECRVQLEARSALG